MKSDPLTGKIIVITGASSGIGAATALCCGAAGMNVVLAARRERRLLEIARQVDERGGTALPVRCDVSRAREVRRLFHRTVERFGRCDVLFANAGYGLYESVLETTDRQIRDLFRTNVLGTVRCIREAVRHMDRGGHVLVCSSAASEISIPMFGFYASTKAAQDSIAGALRAELHDRGIFVSTVHPVGTRTEFFEAAERVSPRAQREGGVRIPAALVDSPEKVARAIVRCLRRPRPEVWPSLGTRLGVALTTAVPQLGAWALRQMMVGRFAGRSAEPGGEPVPSRATLR